MWQSIPVSPIDADRTLNNIACNSKHPTGPPGPAVAPCRNCDMPLVFKCMHCKLGFTTGWYHYQRQDSGYCARTLLVCTECGTQHAIEHALLDRGNEFFDVFRITVDAVSEAGRQMVVQ